MPLYLKITGPGHPTATVRVRAHSLTQSVPLPVPTLKSRGQTQNSNLSKEDAKLFAQNKYTNVPETKNGIKGGRGSITGRATGTPNLG